MIRGIHHLALNTPNFDRMIAFYREAFGFVPVAPEFKWKNNPTVEKTTGVKGSAARTLMLAAGNCYLEMFEYFEPQARNASAAEPYDRGYTHMCVDVTDIAAEQKRLEGLGMTFANPEPVDHGDSIAVYGKDMDGNVIEIFESRSSCAFGMSRLKAHKTG